MSNFLQHADKGKEVKVFGELRADRQACDSDTHTTAQLGPFQVGGP